VCALGGDGQVWNFRKTGSGLAGKWSPSSPLTGTSGLEQIVFARNADKSLSLYALAGGRLFRIDQGLDSLWSHSHDLGTNALEQITITSDAQVYALAGGTVWHVIEGGSQQAPGVSGILQIAAATNASGQVEVFGLGADDHVWQFGPTGPNSWSQGRKIIL
jgi:hypothetical protein